MTTPTILLAHCVAFSLAALAGERLVKSTV